MKLNKLEKEKLIVLSEKASEFLIEILEENLPKEKIFTKKDIEFNKMIREIYQICPELSEGYVNMYNSIQKKKVNSKSKYLKRLLKNE